MKFLTSELKTKIKLMFGFWLALIASLVFMDIIINGWTLIRIGGLVGFGYLGHQQITKNSDKMGIGDIMAWVAISIIVLFVIVIVLNLLGEFLGLL